MISREWVEPAIAVAEEEWHRGRVADPTAAPCDIPDLSQVTGYSVEDVRYKCVGNQSPAQRRLWRKTLLLCRRLFGAGQQPFVLAVLAVSTGDRRRGPARDPLCDLCQRKPGQPMAPTRVDSALKQLRDQPGGASCRSRRDFDIVGRL